MTISTNWNAWYASAATQQAGSNDSAYFPWVQTASSDDMPSPAFEMLWNALTGAAGAVGDVVDGGATAVGAAKYTASMWLENTSWYMAQLNGSFAEDSHTSRGDADVFWSGYNAWLAVHANSMKVGAFTMPKSVANAILDSSDLIVEMRQAAGVSYSKLIYDVQKWKNDYQINWMVHYEEKYW